MCDRSFCRRSLAARQAAERRRRREREQRVRARAWYSRLREEDGARYPVDALVAVLPVNRGRLGPLPPERRAAIRDHLKAALSEAKARSQDPVPLDGSPPEPPFQYRLREEELPVLAAACVACGGYCCSGGGDHAFLSSDEFLPRLHTAPDLPPGDLLSEYLDLLPDAHYENQCVFHGATGCALPREKRSATCNSFLCNSLLKLGEDYLAGGPRPVFGVSMKGESIRGGALLEDGRVVFRVEPDPDSGTFCRTPEPPDRSPLS